MQKAPDYSFRLAGVRKFFVEAKKPSVNVKTGSTDMLKKTRTRKVRVKLTRSY